MRIRMRTRVKKTTMEMTDLVPQTMKTKVLRPKIGEKDEDKDEN